MTENKNKRIKTIIEQNPDIGERFSDWSVSYDKNADLFVFGEDFSKDSSYVLLSEDDGVMVRVDATNKILGFAIENTRNFIKKYPTETSIAFHVYPVRTRILIFLSSLHYAGKNLLETAKLGLGTEFMGRMLINGT